MDKVHWISPSGNGQNIANPLKFVRYSSVNGQKMANPLEFVRYPSGNGQTMANLLKSVHNLCSPSQSASHYMLEINFHLLTKIHLKGELLMKHIQTPYDIGDKQEFENRKLSQSKYDGVHIQLKKAEEIKTHHAKEETLIVVRSGKIRMKIEAETVELTNEDILQMEPYEKHDLYALEETDLLLIKFK